MKKRRWRNLELSILIIVFLATTHLFATIINVPEDYGTIQQAIDESVNGDTVLVDQGEYFENINFLGKAITVASNHLVLQDTTIIQNTIINGNTDGVVFFENNEDSLSIICGFSIINGGVGIWCLNESSPKILDNYIFDNSASGIACNDFSSPLITGNRIYNNTYNGVYCNNFCNPEILENQIFENNYPNIYCENESNPIIIENIILNSNEQSIYIGGSTNTIIKENIISNPQSNGIAIFNSLISISKNMISNCGYPGIYCGNNTDGDIVNNIIDESEWGLYLENQSNVNIIGNVISNSPKDGICIVNSNPFIVNNTIVNNGLDYPNCAGIYLGGDSEAEIINSIIWDNAFDILFLNSLSSVLLKNSLIEANSYPEQVIDNGGNLLAIDPLFLNETNCNFCLDENSPCIDSGTLDFPNGITLPQYDILNNDRIVNSQVDIGAYEWNYETGVGYETVNIPMNDSSLLGNFPNPFNPVTTIEFNLKQDSFAEIEIFNIKGQKVKSLGNRVYKKGLNSILWNGKDSSNNDVCSGVYFYKLNTNKEQSASIKKCILLK